MEGAGSLAEGRSLEQGHRRAGLVELSMLCGLCLSVQGAVEKISSVSKELVEIPGRRKINRVKRIEVARQYNEMKWNP